MAFPSRAGASKIRPALPLGVFLTFYYMGSRAHKSSLMRRIHVSLGSYNCALWAHVMILLPIFALEAPSNLAGRRLSAPTRRKETAVPQCAESSR